ncbi:hypothetical protein KUTeg_006595 [Tegillarca granosa]|uniref:Major facilitator superfamily (MFS) profile domain-containing protein n=1 Tax=Tegillarca granosa TaxID=220873 RepID=A0ABQ9FFJ8_TEGGR|nr:hypothetical protein KUTeg_006595 [Tegillarca granosa]
MRKAAKFNKVSLPKVLFDENEEEHTGRNLGGDFYVNFLISGLVEFPAYTLTILLLDRIGRKKLHCLCMVLGGTACLSTIFTILYGGEKLQALTVTLAMVGKLGAAAAFAVIYVFSAELYPTVVRNAGMGASSCCARIGGMVAPYVADSAKMIGGDIGQAVPLIIFGAASVFAGILSLWLPETLGHKLPETIEDGIIFGTCSLPGYNNDSYNIQSDFHTELVDMYIPLPTEKKKDYEDCHVYQTNISTYISHNHTRIGRKKAIQLSFILVTATAISLAFSPNYIVFVILYFLLGAANAGVFTTRFVIGLELVGPTKRKFVGIATNYFFAIGLLVLAGVGYLLRDWQYILLALSAPTVLLIPESPRWLLSQGRITEANEIVRKAAKVNKVTLPEKIFDKSEAETPANNMRLWHLFTSRVLLSRTLIIFINW